MKKVNKLVALAGISLFSTVILSGINTPVKADDLNVNNNDNSSLTQESQTTEGISPSTSTPLAAGTADSSDTPELDATKSVTPKNDTGSEVTPVPQSVQAQAATPENLIDPVTVNYIDQTGDTVSSSKFDSKKTGDVISLTAPDNYSFDKDDLDATESTTSSITVGNDASYDVHIYGKELSGVNLNLITPETSYNSDSPNSNFTVNDLFIGDDTITRFGDYCDLNAIVNDKYSGTHLTGDKAYSYYLGVNDIFKKFCGYTFNNIKHDDNGVSETNLPIISNGEGKIKLNGVNSIGRATFDLNYSDPTQSLPIVAKFLDVDGNQIRDDDIGLLVKPKTTYSIKELAALEEEKQGKIDGYTFNSDLTDYYMSTTGVHKVGDPGYKEISSRYYARTSSFSPNWNSREISTEGSYYSVDTLNEIVFIYTKNDKVYNSINYIDQSSGETIYTYISKTPVENESDLPKISDFSGYANDAIQSYTEVGTPMHNEDGTWAVPVKKPEQKVNTSVTNIVIDNVMIPYSSEEFESTDTKLPSIDAPTYADYELSDNSTLSTGTDKYFLNELIKAWFPDEDYSGLSASQKIDKINEYLSVNIANMSDITMTYDLKYDRKASTSMATKLVIKVQTPEGDKTILTNDINGTADSPEDISKYLVDTSDYKLIRSTPPLVSHEGDTLTVTFKAESIKKPSTGGGSGSSSGSSTSTDPAVKVSNNLSVHPTIDQAQLYDDNGNELGKELLSNSNWYTDQKKTVNGTTYYRVATNTWVKDSDVYIYFEQPTYVRTYLDSYKTLINSQEKSVTNRALQAGSDWYSDRYAYFDGAKYYRVATNEWVKVDDVFEYTPIDHVVTTTGNEILNELGENVGTLDAGISLKTDKIAVINGDKMYRVATNEWIK